MRRIVAIADLQFARAPDELITYALGSCVGVCLYDPARRMGALAHIVLPGDPPEGGNPCRYAGSCVPLMVAGMEKRGCRRAGLRAKLAGGARMFAIAGVPGFDIGARNVAAVRGLLEQLGVALSAEDTGLNYGRTVCFQTADGGMQVRSFVSGTKLL